MLCTVWYRNSSMFNRISANLIYKAQASLDSFLLLAACAFSGECMNIFEKLYDKQLWYEYLNYKVESKNISNSQANLLREYIQTEKYVTVIEKINSGCFGIPQIKRINKKHSDKKRLVFTFDPDENYLLKMIAYLLNKYDFLFSNNLYSFRKRVGVKNAIYNILDTANIEKMYSYKVDIHDYFNSVDISIASQLVSDAITDDPCLKDFLISLIKNPFVKENDKIIECRKGILAGVPISGFLANLYLCELDKYFFEKGILYARYSDDIIVFSNNEKDILLYENIIKEFLKKQKLEINQKKEIRTVPGEGWEFLGFSYRDGKIDISKIALSKLKGKMKRKADALVRWKNKKHKTSECAVKAFIRYFNKKLYHNTIHNDITWSRWYFPIITTSESLKKIDQYYLMCIRYISTGKHTKANYNLRYETIKSYGYKSLVNSYYNFKEAK